jgi:hypothetical protein
MHDSCQLHIARQWCLQLIFRMRNSEQHPPFPAIMAWIFVWKYIFEPFIHILQHFVLQLSRSTNFCFYGQDTIQLFQIWHNLCSELTSILAIQKQPTKMYIFYILI